MNEQTTTQRFLVIRYLVAAAALVVVIAGLKAAAQGIVVPFLLAVFLAVVLAVPLDWLHRRGVPMVAALLIVAIVVAVACAGVVLLVSKSVADFSKNLPTYQEKLREDLEPIADRLEPWGITIPQLKNDPTSEADPDDDPALADDLPAFDASSVLPYVNRFLGELTGLLSNAVVIGVAVIFMLLEAGRMPDKLRAAVDGQAVALDHVEAIVENIRRYMAIKTMTSALTGVLVSVLLWLLGIDYPLLWGLIAFLLNYVPNIGSILAAIPAVILAVVTRDMTTAIWTAAGYVAVNCAISYLIEPRFMGQGLGLSTLVVFLSLVFWGWVLGPIGMLLSAPLTMVVKIILTDYEETRPIAILLGPAAPPAAGAK